MPMVLDAEYDEETTTRRRKTEVIKLKKNLGHMQKRKTESILHVKSFKQNREPEKYITPSLYSTCIGAVKMKSWMNTTHMKITMAMLRMLSNIMLKNIITQQ